MKHLQTYEKMTGWRKFLDHKILKNAISKFILEIYKDVPDFSISEGGECTIITQTTKTFLCSMR